MRCLFCPATLYLLAVVAAFAQNPKVLIQAEKSWIQKFDLDQDARPPRGQESGYYYLLLEKQQHVYLQEVYRRYAYKFLTHEGVQEMSDITVSFDPKHETLIFHNVVIHRDGKVMHKLPAIIKTIQHEESMDRFLYDESHTAVINLPDIRVGDVLEYSYTVKGFNPAFKGHLMDEFYADRRVAFEKNIFRLVVPSTMELNLKNVNTNIQPQVTQGRGEVSYLWVKEKSKGLIADNNAPTWYNPFQRVLISSFNTWQEVSEWGAALYRVSDSEKKALWKEVDKVLTDSLPDQFVMKAIRFVQDDIRYLGFEGGLNGYKPHSPLMIWNQRFGDCKDKSLLLCTILESKAIEAYPMLVNTREREKIREGLPSIVAFDHCVVQFKFNGKTYYVDPTISNQGGTLDTYSFPDYGLGLVLNKSIDLTALAPRGVGYQKEIQTFTMDSVGGGADMEVRTIFEGSAADRERSDLSNARLEAVQKKYKDFYADQYPDIVLADDMQVQDIREDNKLITIERYFIKKFWEKADETNEKIYCAVRATTLESYFNVSKSLDRDAPYNLSYPLDKRHEIRIRTPTDWNITPDETLIENEYYKYAYKARYSDSVIVISTEYQTKADAVPVEAIEIFVSDHGKMMDNLSFYLSWDPIVKTATTAPMWPGIVVLTLVLSGSAFLAIYGYRKYDPQGFYPSAWGQRIDGWLYFPAIGVILSPLFLLHNFVTEPQMINGQAWVINYMNGDTGLSVLALFEQVYNAGTTVFSVLMIVLFFQRRSSVPQLMIFYYGIPVAWLILDALIFEMITSESNPTNSAGMIMRSLVAAAIWVPYFKTSQRVKKTFVNRYNKSNDAGAVALQTAN